MTIFLISISFVLLITTVYFIYRAYILAGVLADSEEYIKDVEDLSTYMYRQINDSYEEMKRIDHMGAFHEDDESGTTFAMLKDVVEKLYKEFNAEKKEKE
jgi:hypothetical protein